MNDPLTRTLVGVISDTHGELPDAALAALAGCDLIIHAGDVGSDAILFALQVIAPVVAVAGNTDPYYPGWPLEAQERTEVAGVRFLVVHDVMTLGGAVPDADVVISGHTHYPQVLERAGVLYLNPGSTSKSRAADGSGSVATITLAHGRIRPRIISL